MKAAPEDKLVLDKGKGGFPTKHVLLILAIVAVAVLLWQSMQEKSVEEMAAPVVVEEVVAPPAPLPPAKDIPPRPEPILPEASDAEMEVAPALPALEDSDAMVREQLTAAGVGPELDRLEQEQNLIQQGAVLIDGFSRGLVLRKLLPIDPPKGDFSVREQGEQMLMDPAGYARYDSIAEGVATLDAGALVENFHTMRPLYEQAYGQLGLDPAEFDNAVIRMLDRVLDTPEIEEPIELSRKSVMYQYADPQLEQLTPMQKQLLRMGPENIRRIKEQARLLRAGLLSQP